MPKTSRKSQAHAAAQPLRPGIAMRLSGGLREALETYGEAVSLAEAGQGDLARQILGEFYAEHRKILVLAEGDGIPEAMATYSVNLAERLGFDLVLLTVGASNRREADFEAQARAVAQVLFEEAARRKVSCAHILRQGDRHEVLNAVSLELRRVEFVITRRLEAEKRQAALMVPEFSFHC